MGSINTHLSNFIDTWDGWAKVLTGLSKFSFSEVFEDLKFVFTYTKALLSSK
ncbi:hypothetical protein FRC0263_02122 [Corynebacterium diphtheriae]|nr:hypothetical protein FRC0135_01855 [Corynebacterium diphtheriae]CAB0816599.1 hypothetical protein FRC0263_02122 [Corynebacterium diphtheriae]